MTRSEMRDACDDLIRQLKYLKRRLKHDCPEKTTRRVPPLEEWTEKGNKWITTVNRFKLVIYRYEGFYRWYIYDKNEKVRIADSRKGYETRTAARGRICTYFKYNVKPADQS